MQENQNNGKLSMNKTKVNLLRKVSEDMEKSRKTQQKSKKKNSELQSSEANKDKNHHPLNGETKKKLREIILTSNICKHVARASESVHMWSKRVSERVEGE